MIIRRISEELSFKNLKILIIPNFLPVVCKSSFFFIVLCISQAQPFNPVPKVTVKKS